MSYVLLTEQEMNRLDKKMTRILSQSDCK